MGKRKHTAWQRLFTRLSNLNHNQWILVLNIAIVIPLIAVSLYLFSLGLNHNIGEDKLDNSVVKMAFRWSGAWILLGIAVGMQLWIFRSSFWRTIQKLLFRQHD